MDAKKALYSHLVVSLDGMKCILNVTLFSSWEEEVKWDWNIQCRVELERAWIVYENARECVFTRTVCFRAGFRHIQVKTVLEGGGSQAFELISNKRFWYVDAGNPTLEKAVCSVICDILRENCHRYFHSHSYLTHKIKQINDALTLSVVHEMSPKH